MPETKTFYDIQLISNKKIIHSEEFIGKPERPSGMVEEIMQDNGTFFPTGNFFWNDYIFTLKKFENPNSIDLVEITAYCDKSIETWELSGISNIDVIDLDEDTLQIKLSFSNVNFFVNT